MEFSQKSAFLAGEGDEWFRRNAEAMPDMSVDAVLKAVKMLGLSYSDVLEIGCANAHRLTSLMQGAGGTGYGVDPSAVAIENAKKAYPDLHLSVGTADTLPVGDESVDLVIFGFCFYLVDPKLHLRAVAEADRVLRDKGALVIFDFVTPQPYHNDYKHLAGLRSHKMEYCRYFTASPAYTLVHRELSQSGHDFLEIDNRTSVDVLIKDWTAAFPKKPF